MNTSDLTSKLVGKPKTDKPIGLSTGSTMLNLACTGKPWYGFLSGCYYYFVGDSTSGKTWLSLTCFAEACRNPKFDDYRLIYDNAENGALMDWQRFFGKNAAERVETDHRSVTIEDFYFALDDAKKVGKPYIYVLDSMDAISSSSEQELVGEQKKAYRAGKKMPGSYGDGKAKQNSMGLRQVIPFLEESGSILILISQTRDNIGRTAQFNPKTRAGGRALTFYAALEMWTTQAGHIKKKVREKIREFGIYSQVRVKKNRIIGKDRTVTVPIYHSVGIDDIGSCIDYLLEEKHWKKTNGGINAKEFEFKGGREALVHYIEEEGLEKELRLLVADVWNEIEALCTVKRKSRYD